MKIVILFKIVFLMYSSTLENFTIKSGAVVWENIQTTVLSDSTINAAIITQLQAKQTAPNTYTTEIKNIPIDFEGAGYKKLNAPIICQGTMSATVTIQTKVGKYKATVTNIKLTAPWESNPTPLETYAIKKGNQYRSPFKNHISKIINHTLTQKTTLSKLKDW